MPSVSSLATAAVVALLAAASARAGDARQLRAAPSQLGRTPPMGWMSWEIFRCDITCKEHNDSSICIDEWLYKSHADHLAEDGYLAAGYSQVHVDDCWMRKTPPRDPSTNQLVADPTRFPGGLKALADYTHSKGVGLGLYTAESAHTCAGYPASKGYEEIDAKYFAAAGVDYLKVDGCGDAAYYPTGYPKMGAALLSSGRAIEYSCSWPAYLGNNESSKPYPTMIKSGCNLWRNYADIQCNWNSLAGIIEHWGDWGPVLKQFAAPGHWNDPDMLLIGNDCINDDEARTQMAMWSIFAAPLIMGNDLRKVSASTKAILLNADAIKVNQDPMGEQGLRVSPAGGGDTEVWARNLTGSAVAVGLFNKNGGGPPPAPCPAWNHTTGGYLEACGGPAGNLGYFSGLSVAEAQDKCCNMEGCAGFSYSPTQQNGFYKNNTHCGFVKSASFDGYYKPHFAPPTPGMTADITVNFADVGFKAGAKVNVFDIWAGASVGSFTGSYTANGVPFHGTAFLRLTAA